MNRVGGMDRLKVPSKAHSFSTYSLGSFSPSSSTLSSNRTPKSPKASISPSYSPSKSISNPNPTSSVMVIIPNKNIRMKTRGVVSALGRKVIVEKFNPRNIASSSPKQHVKTDMNDKMEPRRWAEKKLYKKDIEAKPWYV
ncbi:hypothetical protein EON65_47235 [archaeon]|nr:MAG: hypothetical protein EON65_47235 [archaeon]